MKKYVFAASFLFALIFQGIWWGGHYFLADWSMWAHQAQYVVEGNPEQFNKFTAYGHPGGTVIDGVIFINKVFKQTYDSSVLIFLTVFNSLVIGFIGLLCYILRKNSIWWIAAVGILSVNMMFEYVTPPSAVAPLLVTLLALLTLYIWENKEKLEQKHFFYWSLTAGLAVSTRVDIGTAAMIAFLVPLFLAAGFRKTILASLGAFLSFAVFNPFMWFMPFRHIYDLIYEVFLHYANFSPNHLGVVRVIDISSLSIISVFLALIFLFARKKIQSPIPSAISLTFLFMTGGLYAILLTSDYQAERYFAPTIFIWEALLPLFIFSLLSNVNMSFIENAQKQKTSKRILELFVTVILVAYQMYFMFEFIWFSRLYA